MLLQNRKAVMIGPVGDTEMWHKTKVKVETQEKMNHLDQILSLATTH